jgi:hypothetical protein
VSSGIIDRVKELVAKGDNAQEATDRAKPAAHDLRRISLIKRL